jgi:dihydrofolate reductase
MRRVVLSMMISLDGFIAGPDLELDWMISPDPEREAEHLEFIDCVDTILIGHGVYHDMVDYWPSATGEFADRVNAMPKLVVSSTREELAWNNASQLFVDGDLPGSVADLKTTSGKDIVLDAPRQRLSLREAQPFPSGALLASYAPFH